MIHYVWIIFKVGEKRMNDWHCEMCGLSLDEACREKYPMLFDRNTLTVKDYYQWRMNIYIRDRTRKSPKRTCSKSCGYNLSAWSRNLDSKKSYIKGRIDCLVCGRSRIGGRIIIRGEESLQICRGCHRTRLTRELRKLWEITNHSDRLDYQRKYYSKNRKKINQRKRSWRMAQKALEGGI